MAEYTGGESIQLNAGDFLETAVVANIDYTGQDAYAREVIASDAALGNISISSGGSVFMRGADATAEEVYVEGYYAYYNSTTSKWETDETLGGNLYLSGGVVNSLTLDREGRAWVYGGTINEVVLKRTGTNVKSTAQLRMQGDGVVMGGSNEGEATEIYASGGVISNFTMNANMHAFVSSTAELRDCTFSGNWIRQAGGTLTRVTFLNAKTGASNGNLGGKMVDCVIAPGAFYQMSGGTVSGLTISGVNAKFRVSGRYNCTLNNVSVYAGGSMGFIGAASGKKVTANTVVVSGLGADRATLTISKAEVDNVIVHSGGSVNVSNGGIVTDLHLIGNTNGSTAAAQLPYVSVYAGGKVIGGDTVQRSYHFLVNSSGYVENFIANSGGYFYVYGRYVDGSGWVRGVFSGGEIHNYNLDLRGGLAINTIVDSGGRINFARSSGGLMSNVIVGSRGLVQIASGGSMVNCVLSAPINGGAVVSGANFDLIQDVYVSSGGSLYIRRIPDAQMQTEQLYSANRITVSGGSTAALFVSSGIVVSNLTVIHDNDDVTLNNTSTTRARAIINSGATVESAIVGDRAIMVLSSGAVASDVTLYKTSNIKSGTSSFHTRLYLSRGAVVSGLSTIGSGTMELYVMSGTGYDIDIGAGAYLLTYDGGYVSGGLVRDNGDIMMRGGLVEDVVFQSGGYVTVSAGAISSSIIRAGGSVMASSGAQVKDVQVSGGVLYMRNAAAAENVTVFEGGSMVASGGGMHVNVTVSSGGVLLVSNGHFQGTNAEDGAKIILNMNSLSGETALFDSLENVGRLDIENHTPAVGTYLLADAGNASLKVGIVGSRVFEGEVAAGRTYVDPFIQREFALDADGTTLTAAAYARTETAEAADFATSGATINGGDKELMWQQAAVAGAVKLVNSAAAAAIGAHDVWLDIRAANSEAGAAIYGTDAGVDFDGKINYQIHAAGAIGNFAAGAGVNGSVKGVNILTYNNTYNGVGYAGGFGSVDEDVEVVIAGGNTLNKDFYAGALYNARTATAATSVGDISFTIQTDNNGLSTVRGNIYGASAVKAGSGSVTTPLHTVGDVSLTLVAGTATKYDFCAFAGGYATGTATGTVYTVDSVTVDVAGGSWGTLAGGRGIFGGIMADGVTAEVANGVNISVTGGTMGNVYGGGWSQRDGSSVVTGGVNITVSSGGTVTNVFGGGSHSTSGGASTVAGGVNITISGGSVTGSIYARGHLTGDAVTGDAVVTFTGSKSYACAVYGYNFETGAVEGDSYFVMSEYTGTLSGKIGGFRSISVTGNTKAKFAPEVAADVDNGVWTFDLSARYINNASTAMLTWTGGTFEDDSVKLVISDGLLFKDSWCVASGIADVASAAGYEVKYGEDTYDLAFDELGTRTNAIASGDFAGWGLAFEDSTLKFQKLA